MTDTQKKKNSQKYFIMVSSSLMVQLDSTFHWTNQQVHHSAKCCVTRHLSIEHHVVAIAACNDENQPLPIFK